MALISDPKKIETTFKESRSTDWELVTSVIYIIENLINI